MQNPANQIIVHRQTFRHHQISCVRSDGCLTFTMDQDASAHWGAYLNPGWDTPRHAAFREDFRRWAAHVTKGLNCTEVEVYAFGLAGQNWQVDQFDIASNAEGKAVL